MLSTLQSFFLHGFKIRVCDGVLESVSFPGTPSAESFGADELAALRDALSGYTLPLDALPDFHRRACRAMLAIPSGRTLTYSGLAAASGRPRAVRAAAAACARNPVPIAIPCHRVVGKQGLGGFTAGLEWKRRLLELERSV